MNFNGTIDIPEEIRKKLGNYIDKLRIDTGLGFNQLSLKSGLNARTLNEIINGNSKRTNPFHLKRLGEALRIDYKELYRIVGYLDDNDFVEAEELKKRLLEYESKLEAFNNCETSSQIIRNDLLNTKVAHHEKKSVDEHLDIRGLSEEKIEELKKFIKYLKNS